MSKALQYIQATLSRAMTEGQRTLSVSTLDLEEVLAELASLKDKALDAESGGLCIGFARPDMLAKMKTGAALYMTIRRKKNAEYTMRLSTKNICGVSTNVLAHEEKTRQDRTC